MADFGKNTEFQGKPDQPFSSFKRSLTLDPSTASSSPSSNHPQPSSPWFSSRFYSSIESMKGKVWKLRSLFEAPPKLQYKKPEPESPVPGFCNSSHGGIKLKSVKSMGAEYNNRFPYGFGLSGIRLPGTEDRVVVYFTSLHGVRRTYEDCYAVRMIFRGFRVWVDERDISMDSGYKKELQGVLEEKNVSLPQVFIRGCYVGGADVIKQMFETRELAKVLDGFPKREPGIVCQGCGDLRFVPCGNCSGSRKVFDEDDGVLKRCLECNENGLIRCPQCCL